MIPKQTSSLLWMDVPHLKFRCMVVLLTSGGIIPVAFLTDVGDGVGRSDGDGHEYGDDVPGHIKPLTKRTSLESKSLGWAFGLRAFRKGPCSLSEFASCADSAASRDVRSQVFRVHCLV